MPCSWWATRTMHTYTVQQEMAFLDSFTKVIEQAIVYGNINLASFQATVAKMVSEMSTIVITMALLIWFS